MQNARKNIAVIQETDTVDESNPQYQINRRQRLIDKLNLTSAKKVKLSEVQGVLNQHRVLEDRKQYFKTLDARKPVFQMASDRDDAVDRLANQRGSYTKASPFAKPKKTKTHLDQLFQLTQKA